MNALPKVVCRESGVEELFVLSLDPEHPVFQGHFPGNPILAGVVQVDWAVRFGAEVFGPLGDFLGIKNLKFMDLIRPEERIELYLTFDRQAGKLGFRFQAEAGRKSAGVVLFSVS